MAYKSGHIYLVDHEPNSEELATFTKPVQFDVCVAGLYYSILYDKNGNKFVQNQNKVITGFIKIGEIVQNENQIIIGVHPSGFNHWRINGVDVTTDQPSVLEIDPVADGEFRIDWIVGNSAGGLFILPGEAGKFPIKRNPLDYPNFAFFTEVQVTPDGLGGLVELNLSNIFTGNAADVPLNVKEASATDRGTMSSAHWSKLENINLSNYVDYITYSSAIANKYSITTTNISAPDATYWAALITDSNGIVRRLNLANYTIDKNTAVTQSITSSLAIGQTTSDEKLHVNGRTKSLSFILSDNITTSVPYEISRKAGKIGYAAADGIFKELAVFGSIYEHNVRGKVLTNSTTTGTFNCDLNAYTRWILTLTGNTTLAFTNMILADETVTVSMTVTGNFTLAFPTWLKISPYSDIYDGAKINRIVIEIAIGGSSPSGWYSITKMDS